MVEARQHVLLFRARAQALEELMLWIDMHYPIRARDQHLDRQADRLRIGDDALGRVVEPEQDPYRDGARDEPIVFVGTDALGVVRQELGLDVRIDEVIANQAMQQAQAGARERDV